jgi:SAM-dependent methyltransferase
MSQAAQSKAGAAPETRKTAEDPHARRRLVDALDEGYQRINLGCGMDQRSDWLNVDIAESVDPDFVWDLEDTPWPFPDDAFSEALMDNVLEHIRPKKRHDVLDEVRRILRRGGELTVRLPVPTVGVGWDVTHHAIPSWELFDHPHLSQEWLVTDVTGSRVGVGRLLPDSSARALTKWQVIRAVDEVEIVAAARRKDGDL